MNKVTARASQDFILKYNLSNNSLDMLLSMRSARREIRGGRTAKTRFLQFNLLWQFVDYVLNLINIRRTGDEIALRPLIEFSLEKKFLLVSVNAFKFFHGQILNIFQFLRHFIIYKVQHTPRIFHFSTE